ncbi:uncharacterized protein VTP21DRAFT_10922 [Calcarisporiella thermophila]|uniref:uncharacterized protein n=1 Tax=Calcarisporiella thermophila TaxID=911321 RepID=UPI00374403F5
MGPQRRQISINEKLAILNYKNEHPNASLNDLKEVFKIGRSTIFGILKERSNISQASVKLPPSFLSRTRIYDSRVSIVDETLYFWYKCQRGPTILISGDMLKNKARTFYNRLSEKVPGQLPPQFSASNGWLQRFKKRYNLPSRETMSGGGLAGPGAEGGGAGSGAGEGAAANIATGEMEEVRRIVSNYAPEDVYCADEVSLYYHMLPDRSEMRSGLDRFTILFCCNATGTDKIPPLVVSADGLNGVGEGASFADTVANLGVGLAVSEAAWMRSELFKKWLDYFDERVGRSVVLLIDNAPTHVNFIGRKFKHVQLVYLPTSVSSTYEHPFVAGIANSFKLIYRRMALQRCLAWRQCATSEHRMSLRSVISLIQVAWSKVADRTIQGCWRRSRIIAPRGQLPNPSHGQSVASESSGPPNLVQPPLGQLLPVIPYSSSSPSPGTVSSGVPYPNSPPALTGYTTIANLPPNSGLLPSPPPSASNVAFLSFPMGYDALPADFPASAFTSLQGSVNLYPAAQPPAADALSDSASPTPGLDALSNTALAFPDPRPSTTLNAMAPRAPGPAASPSSASSPSSPVSPPPIAATAFASNPRVDDEEKRELEKAMGKLEDLIALLGMSDPVTAKEYLAVDAKLSEDPTITFPHCDDESLIDLVVKEHRLTAGEAVEGTSIPNPGERDDAAPEETDRPVMREPIRSPKHEDRGRSECEEDIPSVADASVFCERLMLFVEKNMTKFNPAMLATLREVQDVIDGTPF